jgi:hypothetical protein
MYFNGKNPHFVNLKKEVKFLNQNSFLKVNFHNKFQYN